MDSLPLCAPDSTVSAAYETDEYVQLLLRTVREHDAEKLALLQCIDNGLRPAQAEAERLQEELQQRGECIAQLRAELSESRLALQEERERSTRLLYENTVLHARADDDRQRVAAMIQRGMGKSKESKEPKDSKESRGSSMSLRHAARAAGRTGGDLWTASPDQSTTAPALVSAMEAEIHMLREQLDAQRVAYEHERTRRVHEERERTRQDAAEAQRQSAALAALHALHQSCLADLVRTRHEGRVARRALERQVAELRASRAEARRALSAERRRRGEDVRVAAGGARDRQEEVLRRLRAEVAERRAAAERQRRALEAERDAAAAEARRLRAELRRERRRQQRDEERQRLDAVGVRSEVDLMRQALRAMEKKVYYSQARCLSE